MEQNSITWIYFLKKALMCDSANSLIRNTRWLDGQSMFLIWKPFIQENLKGVPQKYQYFLLQRGRRTALTQSIYISLKQSGRQWQPTWHQHPTEIKSVAVPRIQVFHTVWCISAWKIKKTVKHFACFYIHAYATPDWKGKRIVKSHRIKILLKFVWQS